MPKTDWTCARPEMSCRSRNFDGGAAVRGAWKSGRDGGAARRLTKRHLVVALGCCLVACLSAGEVLEIQFPAAGVGMEALPVAAFAMPDGRMVSVVLPGQRAASAQRVDGRGGIALLVHDPVSRLAVLNGVGVVMKKQRLGSSGELGAGAQVRVAGGVRGRVTGWARRHGGRVLPVSLLRINYPGAVPLAGTPLLDDQGEVVAIGYQAEPGREAVGYALPVEVVLRVLADFERDRRVVRTWLGVTLREGAAAPSLVRVEAGSPAARAGLVEGDVLLQVGSRKVRDYAEAVNSFYYLIAGEQAPMRVLRGVEVMDVKVVPQAVATGVGAAAGS